MKIRITNFGPVSSFEFNLEKDMHLILGQNNIGKSYAITVIYLIIKALTEYDDRIYFLRYFSQGGDGIFKSTFNEIKKKGVGNYDDFNEIFRKSLIDVIENTFLRKFQYYIMGTFDSMDSIRNRFSDSNVKIDLYFDRFTLSLGILEDAFSVIELKLNKSITVKTINQKRKSKELESEFLIYNCAKDNQHFEQMFVGLILQFYIGMIEEVSNIVKSIHYLPASRSGLYQALTAFGQIVAQLSKNRSFLSERIELPGISIPLSDYFLELSEIKVNRKAYEGSAINKVAEFIEDNIIKGKVEFDTKNKKLFYTPRGTKLKLDIRSTSSMVSEISPIVSFLRHILTMPVKRRNIPISLSEKTVSRKTNAKPLVFIEEPEAHLHPENQIKMIEAFVKLVNSDVKIVLTTHSNYIFGKLNNLFIKGSIKKDVVDAFILLESSSGSIGRLLEIDEFGISDENFIDTSEKLYMEKIELIEEMNNA